VTKETPYGSWPTPITAALVVRAAARLGGVSVDGDDVWWSEARPEEGGRTVLVRRGADGASDDVLPPPWNVRTAVHEYGGGAWVVRGGTLWFSEWSDQRLYRLDPGGEPFAVTPAPAVPRGDRYADADLSADREWLVCVREHHPAGGGEAVNEIVRIPAAGGEPEVMVSGPDFVSNPRLSPDGAGLCWVEWDHPNMPWDSTRLVARVGGEDVLVAGRPGESVLQPVWTPGRSLLFISDRNGWWNLYRWTPPDLVEPAITIDGDIGEPQWVFGVPRYALRNDGSVVFAYWRDGTDHLGLLTVAGTRRDLTLPYTVFGGLATAHETVFAVAASPVAEPAVVGIRLRDAEVASIDIVRPPRDLGLDPALLPVPEPIEFPTSGGRTAYGLFYPPTNPAAVGPSGERPPLLVTIHGGPTSNAVPRLELTTAYLTSRGIAVVDVNYGGSTGYGRAFRDQLRGHWGIVDVDDCVAAARALADDGRVDGERLLIEGGSAGGFTTLACLAFRDAFAAGCSRYGVADLEALARDTHKFESRYLDGLVGPYPTRRDVYVERSPIHHLDRFDRPLIVQQGLDDPIVPPNQSEMIVDALRAKGVPVAYVAFDGEQHGFRRADSIVRALETELSFFAQICGFEVPAADGITPVDIENRPR
jgi:dipeptidyl aminopeptidase/acylaminoacyl peptidase